MGNYRQINADPAFVERLIREGNLPQAEICCRLVLEHTPDDPVARFLLGWIAELVGLPTQALGFYAEARRLAPQWELPRVRASALGPPPPSAPPAGERFLLIKAWGFGFWADVYHVLGQLLLAEITNRVPVVHWGSNSLFRDDSGGEAFRLYFEPVSPLTVDDLAKDGYDYFPPKWHGRNLSEECLDRWQGPYSRMAGLYYLGRPEKVAVSDFYTGVLDLLPWVPPGHSLHGLGVDDAYRQLIARYLRPRPEIVRSVDDFYAEKLAGRDFLAVHVRGSDKRDEMSYLAELNSRYFEVVDQVLAQRGSDALFLLTDDTRSESAFRNRYGELIVTTQCQRTGTAVGLHYQPETDKRRLGIEVMRDTYLAARAQAFVGNGFSNVSTLVGHLRRWEPGAYRLLDASLHHARNTNLHDRELFRDSR
jgi:hypothetical protein